MRLLAWGWTKAGDKFKSPSDAVWWRARYRFPLWAPLETYLDQMERSGHSPPGFEWDEQQAAGDSASLSHSLSQVVAEDYRDVTVEPTPAFLIPPGRGQMPMPNPAFVRQAVESAKKLVEKVTRKPGQSFPWWALLALGYLVTRKGR